MRLTLHPGMAPIAWLLAVVLLPVAAQQPPAEVPAPRPETSRVSGAEQSPIVQGNAIPVEQGAVLRTVSSVGDVDAGICLVVSNVLRDFCARYPDDRSCQAP